MATSATISARINARGRIVIEGPIDPEFARSLPAARWHDGVWLCDGTPAAVWRLTCILSAPNIDPGLMPLADKFVAGLENTEPCQPRLRKGDAWKHQAAAYGFAQYKGGTMLGMGMGCISGDAVIVVNRAGITRHLPLREAYRRWVGNTTGRKWSKAWKCRALTGSRFGQHEIKAIVCNGVRDVVKVTLDSGKTLRCTPDHRIAQPGDRWTPAEALAAGDEVLCNGSKGFIDKDGYVRVRCWGHHRAWKRGQVYQHILVMEQKLGRPVDKSMHIHHINGIKHDNRPENLELLTPAQHNQKHDVVLRLDGGRTINGGRVVMVPKIAKVVSVEPDGTSDVYDIAMDEPHHNFVADGVVVHNCGKSKVAIDLLVNNHCRSILILCPVSVRGVWRREFEKHATGWADVFIAEGSGSASKKAASMLLDREKCQRLGRPFVCVVNYETARQPVFAAWLLKNNWDAVIADESHRCKSHNSVTGKLLGSLYDKATVRLCLSGTPMPHSPLDVFAQYRFLDPGIFGTSFHRFRDRYARSNPMFPSKVDEWLNQDELAEKMGLLCYHVDSSVLDLPAVMHEQRSGELSDEAMRVYRGLEDDMIADVGSGVVTASNALVRLIRLQQLTSGFAMDENDREHEIDLLKQRLLVDLLEDLPRREPIVVFARFRFDLERVREAAERTGRRYGEISGRQKDLTPHATMPEDVDVLGVQIQSGGVGIDLTRAAYGVYYSIGFSLGDYDQSLARLHRPGQTRPTHFYHLLASGTVDERVYRALAARRNVIEAVLEGLKHGN